MAQTDHTEPEIVSCAIYRERGHLYVEAVTAFGESLTYAFRPVNGRYADKMEGLDGLRLDARAVVPLGESPGSRHYHRSYEEETPDTVLDAVADEGLAVLGSVGAGWSNWEGRPEWSKTYADFSAAEVLREPTSND